MSETMKSVERQMNLGVTEPKNVPRKEYLMKLQIFLLSSWFREQN